MPAMVGFCNAEVKALGPVQLHVVAPVAPPVKVNVAPAQTGFGLADAVTDAGMVFTVTEAVFMAVAEPQELLAVKVYIPAIAVVIDALVGLCREEVKALGPVQLHVVAPVAPPVNVNVAPAQTGFGLADAVTTVGTVFTVTEAVFTAVAEPQELLAVNV